VTTEPGTSGGAAATPGTSSFSSDAWIEAFRRAVAAQKDVFERHAGIEARSEYEGIGEGGDRTLVIDRLCEDAIFAELERLHEGGQEFTAISEERGTVVFGDGPRRVVIDPIDGSLNARRTIPWHSFSVAVADGDSMADVQLGYVYDFGADEEFIGIRGEGATLDGRSLAVAPGDGLEVLALEATKPERLLAAAEALRGRVYRIRTPGSIAISLCYVAAGRFDAMMSTRSSRSVVAAAVKQIASEAGASVAFEELGPAAAPLDLESRYDVAAARTSGDLETVRAAQRQVP